MAIRVSAVIGSRNDMPEGLDDIVKAMWPDMKALDMGLREDTRTFLKGEDSARIPEITQLMPFLEICLKHRVEVIIWQD